VAELWMGAHPKAPSKVLLNGKRVSLADLIENAPDKILGPAAMKFGNQLPYLFKVLAAANPLSIQAHPDRETAVAGFERENLENIPLNAPERNYRDANHKPECICALTRFWGLKGFRKIGDMIALLDNIGPEGLETEIRDFHEQPDSEGLKRFFNSVMTLAADRRASVIKDTVRKAAAYSGDPVIQWVLKIHKSYPDDIGVLGPILLNLVCLEPGQAMYLPAGELHSYLDGTGLEIMANSDNVLRGGLTPKHIDVPELLRVLEFTDGDVEILTPRKIGSCESAYDTPADEFRLSVVRPDADGEVRFGNESATILLCADGAAIITGETDSDRHRLKKGVSVIVPAFVKNYRISGNAVLYRASVPS